MAKEITLKINGTKKTFHSTEDGYFCLNEVWEDFDLKASEHPSEWLDEVGERLIESGQVFDLSDNDYGVWATSRALFMYASWVDYNFLDCVFTSFQLLTEEAA